MPEEIVTNPTPEVVTTQSNVAPNLDNELDAALAKSFKNLAPKQDVVEKEKTVAKEDAKPEAKAPEKEITIELKKPSKENQEPSKKEFKSSEEEKPLPNPENVDDNPNGKGQAAWSALKNNYKRAHRIIEQKDQEIVKLKTSLAERSSLTQKEMEDLKSQNQELVKYRAMIDIQADPDFISKYDQPIEKNISSIKEMLLGMNVSAETVDTIDFGNTKLMDQVIEHVGQHRDKFLARKLQRKVEELMDLTDKRDETLVEQKKNYKEVLESKKKEAFSKNAEGEGRVIKHIENISLGKDREGNQKSNPIPFLNPITPKDGATQPEIDQINNHNRMVELMRQKIEQAIKIDNPEDKAEMILAAVGSHYLAAQLKAAMGKIKSLEDTLNKVSAVNSETEKVKSSTVVRNGNGKLVDTDGALSNFFAKR